jgi:enoyl-CoA hydratase/carnithine racemase
MLTDLEERHGERVMTLRVEKATIDLDVVGALESALDHVARQGIENAVFWFSGDADAVAGRFPTWQPGSGREDMRYFARWDEALARLSRLRAKTFTVYDGRCGAAAVQVGFVTDIRLSSSRARLSLGSLSDGSFPGMGAYWLPKFVGLGNARRLFLVGEELTAERASGLGLIDMVDDTVEAVVDVALKSMRSVTPEAACFTRRILDDCYVQERAAAAELAKAARFKLGMPTQIG